MSANTRPKSQQEMPLNSLCTLVFLLFFCSENVSGQKTILHLCSDGAANRYELVFKEDFEGALDREKWMTSYPWGRHLESTSENTETQEFYTDGNNLQISQGKASFITRKEVVCGTIHSWEDSTAVFKNGKANYRCFDYSSAMLYSKGDFSYGWYEISFRTSPNSTGLWPAFWLYGNSNEIDIFENKGERTTETHWDVHCNEGCKGKKGGWIKTEADFTRGFNTISLQWHRDGMRWYLNGKLYKSTAQFFNNRMNIIINQAVSRGNDKKGFWVGPDNNTGFPATLEVDYIYHYKNIYTGRYWKKNMPETEALNLLQQKDSQQNFSTKKTSARSKQNILASLVYDSDKRSLMISSISGKASDVFIYNDSGKLLNKITVQKSSVKEVKDIPSETVVVIIKNGKYILADKINVRR